MKKKAKNPMLKFRSAIRLIWSRSAERKAILKKALYKNKDGDNVFKCEICKKEWHEAMGQVDHVVALGALNSIQELSDFTERMFNSPQRVIDKLCHKSKTAQDRKLMRKPK